MPGTAYVLGSNMIRTCFFFSNGKYSVSIKFNAKLFVCFSVVGVVVKTWNRFLLRAFFFNVVLVFDLLLQLVFFPTLTSYIHRFFSSLKKFLGPNCFGLFFIDLNLGRFK